MAELMAVAVYMAELMAVLLALQWVEEVKPDRVAICSCAVLMSLQSFSSQSRQGALHEEIQIQARLRQMGVHIRFA
jgi:hypothetical protein